MSFAGDVHFMDRVGARLAANPDTVFGPAAAVLEKADLTMVNLETAITERGTPEPKQFYFRAPGSAESPLSRRRALEPFLVLGAIVALGSAVSQAGSILIP